MCDEKDEIRDYMFFACFYLYIIQDRVVDKFIERRINLDWLDILSFVCEGVFI